MASPLVRVGWLNATVPIRCEPDRKGTGFLVLRATGENRGKVFLVTNKHVLSESRDVREGLGRVFCNFNTRDAEGVAGTVEGEVPLDYPAGGRRYREHPDPDTDVLAIDVTDVLNVNPTVEKKWVGYDSFADQARRDELDITVGEDVVVIGYPLGLRQGQSYLPLLRQGMIATRIGDGIHDQVRNPDGSLRDRHMRAFLIDGGTVPGSSGSPVVLRPVIGRLIGNTIQADVAPPVLLGIVAETMYAPIRVGQGAIPGFAGLGLAFQTETIRETVEEFFQQ